jgi:subtilisin family serine protease
MRRIALAAAIGIVAVTSCAGGGRTLPTPTVVLQQQAIEHVLFQIVIPRRLTSARRPRWVSPSTTSARVTVTPAGAAPLPVSTITCTATTCSGTVDAPVGADSFLVQLYDASANMLATGSIQQTIVLGSVNTINLTFNGNVAYVTITAPTTILTQGTSATIPLSVTAWDSDRNVIAGTFANPLLLTVNDPSGSLSLSTASVPSSSTTVTLTYNGSRSFTSGSVGATAQGLSTSNVQNASVSAVATTVASACSAANTSPQSLSFAHSATSPRIVSDVVTTKGRLAYVPGVVEIAYRPDAVRARGRSIEEIATRIGGSILHTLDFSRSGASVGFVRVAPGTEESQIALLAAQPGVLSATRSPYVYRHTAPVVFPPNPYFSHAGESAPFYQHSSEYGQWDMHIMCLSRAWAYGAGFATVPAPPGALGTGVHLAIIDSGVDTTHPSLSSKIVAQDTFDQGTGNPNTSVSMFDNEGHGTNVAGIAAAAPGNFGFAGAGSDVSIMAYRVFPPPTSKCTISNPCPSANTADVAAAVHEAVSSGARVINLSLGPKAGTACGSAMAQAIADAIASNVVVVVSTGNDSASAISCLAALPGVIAVGASGIDDSHSPATEVVASYSNWSAGTRFWGVVAPGGNPSSGGNDNDALHYISNIDSSTAVGYPSDCTTDISNFFNDCRLTFAGTSQAAPHVSGLAALLVGANPSLTPQQVFNILCATAVDIHDARQGCGRVDAYRAMARALNDSSVP